MRWQDVESLFEVAEHGSLPRLETFLRTFNQGDGDLLNLRLPPTNMTLLHLAARKGDPELAEYLLKRCPSLVQSLDYPNEIRHEQTALHYACAAGRVEMAKLLLSRGADPAANGFWGTHLHAAAGADNEELLDLLIKKGVGVNQRAQSDPGLGRGKMPLHVAAGYGNARAVAFLLKHGADVFGRYDDYGYGTGTKQYSKIEERTALHDAARNGHAEAAKRLLENGADANASSGSKDGASTPLEMAMIRYRWSPTFGPAQMSLAVPEVLSRFGADVNVGGTHLLHRAAARGDVEAVQWLLDHGADANAAMLDDHAVFRRKRSALLSARSAPRSKERAEVIALLKRHGAGAGHRLLFAAIALAVGGLLILLLLLKRG